MYRIILAAAILGFLPALAEAGGGTKGRTGSIRVQNNSQNTLAAILDVLDPNLTDQQFIARGGVLIPPGVAHIFTNVRAGTRNVGLQRLGPNNERLDSTARPVNVTGGATAEVTFQ